MADGDLGAVRRTPRSAWADLAQTPGNAPSGAPGATSPGDPVAVDHEGISSRVSSGSRDELDRALWQGRTLRGLADAASPETRRELIDTILAAGWRPPLPDTLSPWDAYREAYNDFRRDVPSWKAHFTAHHMHALEAALRVYDPCAEHRETQWGVLDQHGQVHSVGVENEAQARAMRSMTPVRREVGPWIEAPRG